MLLYFIHVVSVCITKKLKRKKKLVLGAHPPVAALLESAEGEREFLQPSKVLFVCAEVLWPSQQLRSCRAVQLPINTVPGQA